RGRAVEARRQSARARVEGRERLAPAVRMPRISIASGIELHYELDDYLWPWTNATPVLMVHGHARSTRFWDRWVPPAAGTHRVYRLDLWGCGQSSRPPENFRFEAAGILGNILAAMDALELQRAHWVGES